MSLFISHFLSLIYVVDDFSSFFSNFLSNFLQQYIFVLSSHLNEPLWQLPVFVLKMQHLFKSQTNINFQFSLWGQFWLLVLFCRQFSSLVIILHCLFTFKNDMASLSQVDGRGFLEILTVDIFSQMARLTGISVCMGKAGESASLQIPKRFYLRLPALTLAVPVLLSSFHFFIV